MDVMVNDVCDLSLRLIFGSFNFLFDIWEIYESYHQDGDSPILALFFIGSAISAVVSIVLIYFLGIALILYSGDYLLRILLLPLNWIFLHVTGRIVRVTRSRHLPLW